MENTLKLIKELRGQFTRLQAHRLDKLQALHLKSEINKLRVKLANTELVLDEMIVKK